MEFVGSDDILDDILLTSSTKTEQNVSKFAPKPGCKSKKPLNKKAKPSNTPNAIEVNLGQDANVAKSDAVAKITKPGDLTSELDAGSTKLIPVKEPSMLIKEMEVLSGDNLETVSDKIVKPTDSLNAVASTGAYQSASQCSETETSLQHDPGNVQEDPDDMLLFSTNLTVKQRVKLKSKSALCSKGPKKKSVTFSLPAETEKIPSQEQGLESLDLDMTYEPVEDELSNRQEESLVNIANEHAEFPDNDEEFEAIDEIMDIDSWDEPSIPAKMKNDGADKTSGGLSKINSTRRTVQNDNHMKNDSGDIGDLNESNGKNEDDFETIDEIMDINSWDEPSIPAKMKNKGADKTSGGSSKRYSTRRTVQNDIHMNNDSGDIGDLNESNGKYEDDFETIDEIMDINSWDEPSIPTELENNAADKTSGGSRKKKSAKRAVKNDDHTDNDNWDTGNFSELNDDTNGTKNTTKRKRKPPRESESEKVKEPKKRIPHGTRRKKRQVDKVLLEKSERGIDLTQVPLKDLILIAEAKEKILSKEAANSMLNSNNDSHIGYYENPLDEGFDPDSEEAHRHWLKTAKKINYQTHMNISRSKRWSKEDTALFYESVRDFKTNFAMMVWLFPGRTSRQIKAKFKAEERKHPLELRDALEYRSRDHSLFGKVIEIMNERKKEEDAAANETEEEMDQLEKEENGANSNHKVNDSDKTDPWNDGDFDFNETADWDLDADVPFTEDKEDKVDSEKEKKAAESFEDVVDGSEKKDLWDDDFGSLELNECEDIELETDAASTQSKENKDEI